MAATQTTKRLGLVHKPAKDMWVSVADGKWSAKQAGSYWVIWYRGQSTGVGFTTLDAAARYIGNALESRRQ